MTALAMRVAAQCSLRTQAGRKKQTTRYDVTETRDERMNDTVVSGAPRPGSHRLIHPGCECGGMWQWALALPP